MCFKVSKNTASSCLRISSVQFQIPAGGKANKQINNNTAEAAHPEHQAEEEQDGLRREDPAVHVDKRS